MTDILQGFDQEVLSSLPYDHEPSEDEKLWYRARSTGEKGFVVKRSGKLYMKLDRPNQEILRVYSEGDWVPDFEIRPLTRMQLGQISFRADRELCFFLGMHDKARREWLSLSDEQRIRWTRNGPTHPVRKELWRAVMSTLEKHAS